MEVTHFHFYSLFLTQAMADALWEEMRMKGPSKRMPQESFLTFEGLSSSPSVEARLDRSK